MIIDLLKYQLRLGSPLLLIVVLAAGLVWLFRRPAAPAPRRFLLAMLIGYWLATTPIGANLLVAGLSHGLPQIQTREGAKGADTVVVLGGGAVTYRTGGATLGELLPGTALRVLEAAHVAKLIDARIVIASGGRSRPTLLRTEAELMSEALVAAGLPGDRILLETMSKTTREQAEHIRALLVERGARRFVLVTSPTHMRRALAVFRAERLDPIPSVAEPRSDQVTPPPWWLPNDESQQLSDVAVYDYAATVYYWLRGWSRSPAD